MEDEIEFVDVFTELKEEAEEFMRNEPEITSELMDEFKELRKELAPSSELKELRKEPGPISELREFRNEP